MSRKDFTKLPSTSELRDIINAEAKRDVPIEKIGVHYPNFSLVVELLNTLELPTEIFTNEYKSESLDDDNLMEKGNALIEQAKNKILSLELNQTQIGLLNRIYDYLSEEDIPEQADLIFVFGSKTPVRIEKALELWIKKLSDTIMISGGSPFYKKDEQQVSEAEQYKDLAVTYGVLSENILVETKSFTIPDNVRSSLNLLDEMGRGFSSIILVNSPYVQRRGWVHFKKYLPDSIKIIRVNSATIDKYQKDSWFRNAEGIAVILNEFVKMKIAITLDTA